MKNPRTWKAIMAAASSAPAPQKELDEGGLLCAFCNVVSQKNTRHLPGGRAGSMIKELGLHWELLYRRLHGSGVPSGHHLVWRNCQWMPHRFWWPEGKQCGNFRHKLRVCVERFSYSGVLSSLRLTSGSGHLSFLRWTWDKQGMGRGSFLRNLFTNKERSHCIQSLDMGLKSETEAASLPALSQGCPLGGKLHSVGIFLDVDFGTSVMEPLLYMYQNFSFWALVAILLSFEFK